MVCFSPIQGYQLKTKKTENGKKLITFKTQGLKKNSYIKVSIPCRRCTGCKIDKSREWALRIINEATMHEDSCFLTLTYNEEKIDKFGSLNPKDFTDFMKRFRKAYENKRLRYYQCGEYGEEYQRPHHHVCLFGHDWKIEGKHKKVLVTYRNGYPVYTCEQLEGLWQNGKCEIGDLNWESAAYAARYIIKKQNGERQEEQYKREAIDGYRYSVLPEYSTMSTRPGIGRDWLKMYKADIYPSDFITYKGKKFKVPDYYKTLLEESEREHIEYERSIKGLKKKDEKTLCKLATKRRIKEQSFKRLERNYENAKQLI